MRFTPVCVRPGSLPEPLAPAVLGRLTGGAITRQEADSVR